MDSTDSTIFSTSLGTYLSIHRETREMSESQRFFEPMPDFELPDLGGEPRTLRQALHGKSGAAVVFWSGICSHCQRYDAWLSSFGSCYPDLGLAVVASRQNEDGASIRQVVAERGLTFPILIDADRTVARAFRVEQTPRVFLVDAAGRLIYRGAIDNFKYPRDAAYEGYFEAAAADFSAGRPVGRSETPSYGCPIESVYYGLQDSGS